MSDYSFRIQGNKNILSTHEKTIEFTKDAELTKNGDCILGVNADFELSQLQRFLSCEKVRITIAVDSVYDTVTAVPNKKFSSSREMVIRLSEFDSERTFAVLADKAACSLNRSLIAALQSGREGKVTISKI